MERKKPLAVDFKALTKGEAIASLLGSLNLEAIDLANQIMGMRKRQIVGSGTDHYRIRPFVQGDERRKIDAKASARKQDNQGRIDWQISEQQLEAKLTVYVHIDLTASMGKSNAPRNGLRKGKGLPSKLERAIVLGLASVYMTIFDNEQAALLDGNMNPVKAEDGVERILINLAINAQSGHVQDIPMQPLHDGKELEPHSHMIILSDFLMPVEKVKQMVRNLHSSDVTVHGIQVLDREEKEFGLKGDVKLEDVETGETHIIKAAQTVKGKAEGLVDGHVNDVRAAIRSVPGWTFWTHITDMNPAEGLRPFLTGGNPDHKPQASGGRQPPGQPEPAVPTAR